MLVLVRRRNDFGRALVRALKSRGVPVAGLDRLVLTEQPAVQDLMALADALLLPQDDLTFACLLTSPLGGLSDDSLMELAIGPAAAVVGGAARSGGRAAGLAARPGTFFAALLARVDYVSPYALFAEALGPLGGRARLFARLGPEAAEPVDELLNAALAYARMHPPSLQGFLHWLRRSGAEVKREAEGAGNLVRVMTVHGAKGLQAPLVILPDTTALPPERGVDPVGDGSGHRPRRAAMVAAEGIALRRRRSACAIEAARRRMEEHNRLLYVALTRAEDRLVVCGWQTRTRLDDACWYRLVERGFEALPAEREAFGIWDGELRRHATPQLAEPDRGTAGGSELPDRDLPRWAGQAPDWRAEPPPAEPARPERLAPSRPEGAELGPVPAAASPLAAREAANNRFRRGRLIHALLQHLPDLPREHRAAAARAWLDRPGTGSPAGRSREADRRDAGDPRPSGAGPAVRAGQPGGGAADRRDRGCGGRRAGGSAGGAAGSRADGGLQDQSAPARSARGHAGAVSAADGGLSGRAARDLPRPSHCLRPGLDPGGTSRHPAGCTAGVPWAQPCTRRCLIRRLWFPRFAQL